ncbi:MAG: hypothetical protein U5N86_11220 [Planctomycetota bacterium]|nr:hypothetical protein [Planctomycetota bacterium]
MDRDYLGPPPYYEDDNYEPDDRDDWDSSDYEDCIEDLRLLYEEYANRMQEARNEYEMNGDNLFEDISLDEF